MTDLPDNFKRAQLRPSTLTAPCGRCPACLTSRPRECVRFRPEGRFITNAAKAMLESLPQTVKLAPRMAASAFSGQSEPSSGGTVGEGVFFVIPGNPMGKPRMTQRDKWAKRPAVMRYRAWADKARAARPAETPKEPTEVRLVAYLQFPKSWRQNLRKALTGQLHRHKPDADNLIKCLDALFKHDECIAVISIEKRWEDIHGARLEVTVL